MARRDLLKLIRRKQAELVRLAAESQGPMGTGQIYEKSCELDRLIVQYMRENQQMEFIFF